MNFWCGGFMFVCSGVAFHRVLLYAFLHLFCVRSSSKYNTNIKKNIYVCMLCNQLFSILLWRTFQPSILYKIGRKSSFLLLFLRHLLSQFWLTHRIGTQDVATSFLSHFLLLSLAILLAIRLPFKFKKSWRRCKEKEKTNCEIVEANEKKRLKLIERVLFAVAAASTAAA